MWNVSASSEEEEDAIEITAEVKKEERKVIDNIGIYHKFTFSFVT